MLKNTLFAAGAAIAVIATASLPASATGGLPTKSTNPQPVPEPITILGTLAVGGGFVAKKIADAKQK
ncbi:MAG: PEP-CTERM sorting domain-containing protein [Leptolyngbyaceae cyanobacterium MO_188.B28]|nr:PEP-CTERM sorting domain-containing protein [Leptolyngbyaceae cyanobacterium MO_188.B28]